MTEEQIIAALGQPFSRELKSDGAMLSFRNAKTNGRQISVRILNSKTAAVFVFPLPTESFDVGSLIAKADQFSWTSGILEDSTRPYLIASKTEISIRLTTIDLNGRAFADLDTVILH